MVNRENYEEYMLLMADGELDEAGKAALMAFVAQHPELKKELALYEATRMVPDMEVVYADKSSLTKQAPAKAVAFRSWWGYSAAASVAILIGFLVLRNNDPKVVVVDNQPTKKTITQPVKDSQPQTTHQPPVAPEQKVATTEKENKKQPETIIKQPVTSNQYRASNNTQPAPKERTQDLIASLPTNAAKELPANTIATGLAEHNSSLTPVTPAHEEPVEEKKEFLAWLPIADEKKQGINDLKTVVDNTIQKVQSIKETTVVLKIGNKNLLAFNL